MVKQRTEAHRATDVRQCPGLDGPNKIGQTLRRLYSISYRAALEIIIIIHMIQRSIRCLSTTRQMCQADIICLLIA